MNKPNLDITPKENFTAPDSQGFWYDLDQGDEDKFLDIIEDEETRRYFKEAIKNLRWLKNGISDLVEWYQMKTKSELTLRLSPREKQILELIAAGLVDKEIATELCIAYGTVRNHIDKIILKLGATNRAHAVAIAIRSNII